ncbi:MAG: sugar ABC transporter permease [Rhodobacteraceae bacterium]|nr:sugar ABC transporter permease [Paracoccaceae bacterium]
MAPPPSRRGERLQAALMLYPVVALLALLVAVPVIHVVVASLYRRNLFQVRPPRWVGLENYYYLVTSAKFEVAILRSMSFTVTALAVELALGIALAVWVHRMRRLPGMGLLRTVLAMPILVAPVVAAVMWRFMFQPDFGILNHFITGLGLPPVGWLSSPSIALLAIVLIDVWQWTPLVFLTVLAGLHAIPPQYFEAAELDAAGPWKQTLHVALPQVRRVIVIVALLRLIDLLRAFEIIVATTQGGPGDASYTFPVMIWETAFVAFEIGDAAAASVVLLVLVSVIVTLLVRAIARQGVVGRGQG